jgi:hypothetical protein
MNYTEKIMRNFSKIAICALFIYLLSSCATVIETKPFKTYTVGQTVNANVGMPFLSAQVGTVKKIKHWVGIANSPDGWKIEDVYSSDFVKKELVYSGKSGNTIEISYREYRGGLAAPAFYQSLRYDLSESTLMSFQNFQFQVNSASNSMISVVILHD